MLPVRAWVMDRIQNIGLPFVVVVLVLSSINPKNKINDPFDHRPLVVQRACRSRRHLHCREI